MKLPELKRRLLSVNDQINGLAGIIAHNKAHPAPAGKNVDAQHRVIRRQETLLLERVRLESSIRCIERSDEATFAIAFVDVARAHGDIAEFERLAAITRSHIEQELCA